jgi:methyltransferase (TIGR00027 family)
MREGQRSRTAVLPAVLRAAHQTLDGDPKILLDHIAGGLVEALLRDDPQAAPDELQTPLMKRLRAVFVVRSRYAEDVLEEVSRRGVGQYVILGAGLDTFAYRQPPWARGIRVFEVDHPATQEWKCQLLRRAGIQAPEHLRFCPIDFETTSLPEALRAVSFDLRTPTFFSWLGVTQYLTEAAIALTLEFVLSLPSGSGIVFSFLVPEDLLETNLRQELTSIAETAASSGEPWITRLEPTVLRRRLVQMGFSSVYHLTPESADEHYFHGRSDGLRAPLGEQLMRAIV